MKNSETIISTNDLSPGSDLIYELAHINSISVVLSESAPKNKKVNQWRFHKRSKL